MGNKNIIPFVLLGFFSCLNNCIADTDITFHGTLLKTPVCLINEGKDLKIYFGDIIALNKIQSWIYRQPLGITLTCEDSDEVWKLSLIINGQPDNFDTENSTVVSEQQDSLGVKFYVNSHPLPLEKG